MKDTEPNDALEASRTLVAVDREELMEIMNTVLRLPQLGRWAEPNHFQTSGSEARIPNRYETENTPYDSNIETDPSTQKTSDSKPHSSEFEIEPSRMK